MSENVIGHNELNQASQHVREGARTVLGTVVSCARALVEAMPATIKNSSELARAVKLPKKVAWQLYKLADVNDPLVATSFLPGPKPMRDLLESCKRLGISSTITDALAQAFQAFEAFAAEAAGDRTAFISMIGTEAKDPSGTADIDRQYRLMAFKAYSHFFAMQVDTVLDLKFTVGPQEGMTDEVDLRVVSGMRRFRPDAQWIVEEHISSSTYNPKLETDFAPLDAEACEKHGVPIVPAFCSRPLPSLFVNLHADQASYGVQWGEGAWGLKEPITLTTAIKSSQDYRIPNNGGREYGRRYLDTIGYPVKKFSKFWFFNKRDMRLLTPRLMTFLNPLADVSQRDRPANHEIPMIEQIRRYEPGAWMDKPREMTPIREQVAYVCARMQWDPMDFTIFTLELEYPLVNSKLACQFPWIAC